MLGPDRAMFHLKMTLQKMEVGEYSRATNFLESVLYRKDSLGRVEGIGGQYF